MLKMKKSRSLSSKKLIFYSNLKNEYPKIALDCSFTALNTNVALVRAVL